VTVVGCFSATGVYIPPMVIFKGVRLLESYTQDLPTGSTVRMTESGYINEDVFLEWLQHFQKTSHLWKVPPYIRWSHVSLLFEGFALLSTASH
jgi:hypothetical protein